MFTHKHHRYSTLRHTGEEVKEKNEYLLTCGCTRTRVVREGARDRAFIGEEDGKVGRNEKETGGGSEEGGVNEERKGNQWKIGRWCRA